VQIWSEFQKMPVAMPSTAWATSASPIISRAWETGIPASRLSRRASRSMSRSIRSATVQSTRAHCVDASRIQRSSSTALPRRPDGAIDIGLLAGGGLGDHLTGTRSMTSIVAPDAAGTQHRPSSRLPGSIPASRSDTSNCAVIGPPTLTHHI
jgi:hypothetical protein